MTIEPSELPDVNPPGVPPELRLTRLEIFARRMMDQHNDLAKDVHDMKSSSDIFMVEFQKIKTRLTLAVGIIVGISVALKLVNPDVGELLKSLLAG